MKEINTNNGFIEGIGFQVFASASILTQATYVDANTPVVRQFKEGKSRLLQVFQNSDFISNHGITLISAQFHDAIGGINTVSSSTTQDNLLPFDFHEKLYSLQDITPFIINDNVGATDGGALIIQYDNLPGLKSNLITYEECQRRFSHHFDQVFDYATSATQLGWTNQISLGSIFPIPRIKRDKWYAVAGFSSNISDPQLFRLRGAQFQLPMIFKSTDEYPENYFYINLARVSGLATIPIFYGDDIDTITFDVLSKNDPSTPVVSARFFQLD